MATPTYEIFPGGAVRETTQRYYEPRPHSSEVPRDASITPNRIRSPSPSRLGHGQPHSSPGIGRAAGFDHAPGSRNVSTGSGIGGSNGDGGLSLDRIGKAIVSRAARAARRGNLPFLVIFLSSLIFFFSALAGIGYVDPESVAAAPVADFQPGSPVYNREESVISHGKKADEQKELERSWQRKKRPKDGAWMQVQRDDKAVRRVPVKPPVVEQVDMYDDSIPDLKDGAEQEGLDRREFELSDPERVDDDVADETNAALAEKVRDDDAAALAKEKAEVKAQVKAAEDRKMIVQKAKLDAEIAQLEEAETGDEV